MKKRESSGGRGPPSIGTGLVRASRPGNLPPTDTDSNVLAPIIRDGTTLSYLNSGRPRVQGLGALLQTADRPGGDSLDAPRPSETHGKTERKGERSMRRISGCLIEQEARGETLELPSLSRERATSHSPSRARERGPRRKIIPRRRRIGNDPSAGSPTETLLRLLLPLNDPVWSSSRHTSSSTERARLPSRRQSEDLTTSFDR